MNIVKLLVLLFLVPLVLTGCFGSSDSTTQVCGVTDMSVLAGGSAGYVDGAGAAAKFSSPQSITTDGTNLYVSDTFNDNIRKIVIATGEVSSFASVSRPLGITTDGTYLYVANESGTIHRISIDTGTVTPLSLNGSISLVWGIATDGIHLYLADRGNHRISKVLIATGEVTTLAGSGVAGFADGTGTEAQFSYVGGVALDGDHLYVADSDNARIRKVAIVTGEVTTLAGSGEEGFDDGDGSAAKFNNPMGVVRDGDALYVSDYSQNRIRKIQISTGQVTTLIGAESDGSLFGKGSFGMTKVGSASDPDGLFLYVPEWYNNSVSEIHHLPGECGDETTTQSSVSGTVAGLNARLVLKNGSRESTITENGNFDFEVTSGETFDIAVKSQPNGQVCTVSNGSGTAPAEGVLIQCSASATPPADAIAPTAPTIVDLTTVNSQPILTGTYDSTDAAGGFKVKVNGQTFVLGSDNALTASTNDWTLTMPQAMAVGAYDIVATASDAAGNVSTAAGLLTVVAPPPVPTVNAVRTKDLTPTLFGAFDSANSKSLKVAVNGVTYTAGTDSALDVSGNSWNLTIPDANALSIGTYDVVVTAIDTSNVNKVDGTANELVVFGTTDTWSLEDTYTNDATPTITGTFPGDAEGFTISLGKQLSPSRSVWWFDAETRVDQSQGDVLVDINTGQIVGAFDRATGEWELTLPTGIDVGSWQRMDGLEEGAYLLYLGNAPYWRSTSVYAAADLVVDLTAPNTPTVAPMTGTDTTPTLTGTFDSADVDVLTVSLGNTIYTLGTDAPLTSNGDNWSLAIPSALSPGTYDVVVTVQDRATNSATDSTTNEFVITAPVPAAPTGVMAVPADGKVTVTWPDVSGASSYNVYYGTSSGVTTANTQVAGVSSGDAVTGLVNGTPYYFIVTAVSSGGESAASAEVSATPVDQQAPTVSASPGSSSFTTSVDITLSCSDTGGSGCASIHYTLDDSTPTAGSAVYSAAINISSTTTLKFLAVDGVGNQSSVQSETYTLSLPAAPTGVSAIEGSGQVTLTWTAVSGATSYNVYYGMGSGVTTATGTKVANASNGGAVTGLADGTTYSFIVTAVNASGEGAASSEVSATPSTPDTTPPAVASGGLSPADGSTDVARDTIVTAAFNEDIFADTVDETTFTLDETDAVGGVVTFDGSSNVATFTPDGTLAMLTDYTATLTTGITDLAGNPLASDEIWSFTTADGNWGVTPTTVDTGAGDNNGGRVVVDESGNATAVWLAFDGSINSVVWNRYVPGTGWGSSQVTLESGSGDAGAVELAVDSDGNVFAVWQQANGSAVWHIWAARYDAATDAWGAPVQLDTGSLDAGAPQVAVDGSGNAIVVWDQYDGTRINVWASRYSGSWSAAEKIENDDTTDATAPSIAVDPAGDAVVVWHLGDGFLSGDVKATHYTGGIWSAMPVALESRVDTDIGFGAKVAMDSSGNAIAVWAQADDSGFFNIWANHYDSGAGTWSGASTIADGNGNGLTPEVAMDSGGNALVVWVQDNGQDVWSNRFAVSGSSWGVPAKIDNLAGSTMTPQVAMDKTGHGLAVWFQIDGLGNSSTFAARFVKDIGWGAASVLESDDSEENNLDMVSLSMNSKGEAMAVWHQRQGNGIFDLWANRFE